MSVAIAYVPVRMPDVRVWYGLIESFGPVSIVITDGVNRAVYQGNFTYDNAGNVFGTLTSFTKYKFGVTEYSISGMAVNAYDALILIQSGNATAAANLFFVGADSFTGSSGNDILRSFSGNDIVRGLAGNDVLYGDAGQDSIYGDAGNDQLFGGEGNDLINGGGGIDRMDGGVGNDTYLVDSPADIILEAFGQGSADRVLSSISFSLAADDSVEYLTTNNAAATLIVNLRGNAFAQTIVGNDGANRLNGAAGSDTITGRGGSDVFIFNTTLGASNIDKIVDYSVAADRIEIDNAVFVGLSLGALGSTTFAANASGIATTAAHRIIYETDTGFLWFDANGTAAGGRVQFADLAGGLIFSSSEFTIV